MQYDKTQPTREEEIAHRMDGMMIGDKLMVINAIDSNTAPATAFTSVPVSPQVLYDYCVDNTRI